MERVTGLDRVRALAALSVMLAHVIGPALPDILRFAFTGHPAVIAFFVVSGFCIHYPFVRTPPPTLAFLAARFIRIGVPMIVAIVLARLLRIRGFNLIEGFILWSLVCEIIYYTLYPLLRRVAQSVSWGTLLAASFAASYGVVFWLGLGSGAAHGYGPGWNWIVSLPAWIAGCILAEHVAKSPPTRAANPWAWRAGSRPLRQRSPGRRRQRSLAST